MNTALIEPITTFGGGHVLNCYDGDRIVHRYDRDDEAMLALAAIWALSNQACWKASGVPVRTVEEVRSTGRRRFTG